MLVLAEWAQRILTFRGDAAPLVAGTDWPYQLHIILGLTIFLLFPFSRLVHIWSVPVVMSGGRATRWCARGTRSGRAARSARQASATRSCIRRSRTFGNLQSRGAAGLRPPPPVTVDGTQISEVAIAQEAQHHPADTPDAAREAAASALVVRHVLLAEAARLAIVPEPETDAAGRRETTEEALISTLLRQEVVVPTADAVAARRYYDVNPERFTTVPLFEVRHILFAADAREPEGYAWAMASAEEALAGLLLDPRRFRCSPRRSRRARRRQAAAIWPR